MESGERGANGVKSSLRYRDGPMRLQTLECDARGQGAGGP